MSVERLESRQLLAATLFRINVGGPQVADSPNWLADTKAAPSIYSNAVASGNSVASVAATIDTTSPTLPSGTSETLFKTRRSGPNSSSSLSPMQWDFPVTPGQYEVRLYFAETWAQYDLVGERVFDVAIEGTIPQALDDFDIVEEAGGRWKGIMMSTTVSADNNLDIDFFGLVNGPTLSAIEIIQPTSSNAAPVLAGISDQSVAAGSTLVVPVTATDADSGDVLTFSTANLPSFVTFTSTGARTGSLTIAPPQNAVGVYNNIGIAVSDNGTPSLSDSKTFSVTVTEPMAANTVYRVNAGGPEVAGSPTWTSDLKTSPSQYVNGSATTDKTTVISPTVFIDMTDPSLPAGTPKSLFEAYRWDPAPAPSLQWDFPVTPGAYEVRLYFAETFGNNKVVGARVFNVSIEGNVVLQSYDIFAKAGANKAIVETFTVNADSNLDIDFGHITENPIIHAIEILSLGGQVANSAPVLSPIGSKTVVAGTTQSFVIAASDVDTNQTLALTAAGLPSFAVFVDDGNGSGTLTLSPSAGDVGTYTLPTITVVDNGTPALFDSENFTITVAVTSSAPLYRVNAGGPQLEGLPSWTSDLKTASSQFVNGAATTDKTTVINPAVAIDLTDPSIPAGTPKSLFEAYRWDPATSPSMQWDFPVTPGAYEVRLYFAETFGTNKVVGARVFDVSIEGNVVLKDYDIFARIGGNKGIVERFIVNADANLDIDFGHVTENPLINAIEIVPLASLANVLGVTPASIDFGNVTPGSTVTQTISVLNRGSSGDPSITINSAQISGSNAFVVGTNPSFPLVLAPGQSVNLNVTFTPPAGEVYNASLAFNHSGLGSSVSVPLAGSGATAVIDFGKTALTGAVIVKPTSLQFGPDGRLYVSQQNGLIKAFTVSKTGDNSYAVTATENITLIQQIPNHNDDGQPNSSVNTRLVTGILVTGTAASPVIYVSSSDPRIGAGPSGTDLNLDTNSGMISRLTNSGSQWSRLDLVRGLPRSEENHAANGMQLIASTNTLLVAQGGNTNAGATSNNFALLPEFAYSAAILSIDLNAIGNTTYDLPTLDDEDRPGVNDFNDPFGGNNGKNQAKIVPGSPVQVFSPGFRNAYDLVVTQSGRIYSIDNGANAGWGGPPVGEGPGGNATNDVVNGGATYPDALHLVTQGYYAGHPNPTRSNMANTFNASNPQSPVTTNNPIESDFQPSIATAAHPDKNAGLVTFPASTNGLAEYTASTFGGQMKGDLIAVGFDNAVKRIKLNADGTAVVSSTNLFSSVGSGPLDVTTVGDGGTFAGSIWVADHVANSIVVFTPSATSGGTDGDSDGDGYSDEDEIANGTDPFNAGDLPNDFDGDFISDLLDPDDDNDGLLDTLDKFAIDAFNGMTTPIGTFHTFENDANPGGLLNLGFTGLMTNGVSDYLTLFDKGAITAGGAAGVLTLDALGSGTALGAANNQRQAFQFGFNAAASPVEKFVAKTSVAVPFNGQTPEPGTSFGFYVGLGDQDNFVQLVISGVGGGQIALVAEINGTPTTIATSSISLVGVDFINLDLVVDPVTKQVAGRYQPSVSGQLQAAVTLGPQATIPASWLSGAMAVGIIGTDSTPASPVPTTWVFLGVVTETTAPPNAAVNITPTGGLNASTFPFNSVTISNVAASGGPKITSATFNLATAVLPDLVFDPVAPAAGDTVFRALVPGNGAAETGFITPASTLAPFSVPYQGGYRQLSMSFSDFGPGKSFSFAADIDPTTIKGLVGQGADWAGSISGLEMAGSTFTITFSDGSTHVGSVFGSADENLGQGLAFIAPNLPPAPVISLVGVAQTPTTLFSSNQTVRIEAAPGSKVRLVVAEAALESAVFDVDPFEANNFRKIQKFTATVGSTGVVNLPVTFTNEVPDGGINHLIAAIEDASGRTGATSAPLIVAVDPSVDSNPAFIESNGLVIMEVESRPTSPGWLNENSVDGFTGASYFRYNGPPALDLSQAGVQGLIEYKFIITNPGTYQLRVRNHRDSTAGAGEQNDAWVRLDNGSWEKIFSTAKGLWNWTTRFDIDFASGNQPAASYFLSAGQHSLFLSGRSPGWRIDRIALFDLSKTGFGVAQNLATPESLRESSTASFAAMNVNGDDTVSATDALMIINSMNSVSGEGESGSSLRANTDVNGDGRTTALDALLVINYLSRQNRLLASHVAVDLALLDDDDDRDDILNSMLEFIARPIPPIND